MSPHAFTEDQLVEPPAVAPRGIYAQKCAAVFEHVYESYPERDVGVYSS